MMQDRFSWTKVQFVDLVWLSQVSVFVIYRSLQDNIPCLGCSFLNDLICGFVHNCGMLCFDIDSCLFLLLLGSLTKSTSFALALLSRHLCKYDHLHFAGHHRFEDTLWRSVSMCSIVCFTGELDCGFYCIGRIFCCCSSWDHRIMPWTLLFGNACNTVTYCNTSLVVQMWPIKVRAISHDLQTCRGCLQTYSELATWNPQIIMIAPRLGWSFFLEASGLTTWALLLEVRDFSLAASQRGHRPAA